MIDSIDNSVQSNYPDVPLFSAIISTPGGFDTIRKTVRCLLAQSMADKIELVIVTPSQVGYDVDDNYVSGFFGYKIVGFPSMKSVGAANALGVRAATAPVVGLCEDHSFPDPGWAEALIAAYNNNVAAVGPVIKNANPKTLVSWADLLIAYAPWLDSVPSGEINHLPGHNSSYKREILLSYGDDLDKMMVSESVLHWDLRQKGYKLYLESNAKTAHTNFSLLLPWIKSKFHSGRVFGSARMVGWPRWKQLVYSAASPLIPIVRLWRMLIILSTTQQTFLFLLKLMPVMFAGLSISALGEMAGYAFGPGDSIEKLAKFEFHRRRYQSMTDYE